MSAPLDLDADRLESIRARAVQGYAPTMRDTLNLVAEVERLRAEVRRFQRVLIDADVLTHCDLDAIRATVDAQAEDEGLWFIAQTAPEAYLQQELRRLHAAVESVPRSSLVQVGWWANGVIRRTVSSGELAYTQPVYVLREDTDA